MKEINLPPFYVGESVVVVKGFKKLRQVWGFNYPKKGDVVTVDEIRKHPIHDFWLVKIPTCECELCHRCFAPIEKQFQSISLEKVLEKETPLICVN